MQSIDELREKLNSSPQGLKLQIKVNANAKKNSLEFGEEIIKLKISKPAVDGKANKEIILFFSDLLKIPKSNVKIISGEKSGLKLLLLLPRA